MTLAASRHGWRGIVTVRRSRQPPGEPRAALAVDPDYHRLLHLDWIRADVDGDGRREYVPHADRTGPRPPERYKAPPFRPELPARDTIRIFTVTW